MGIAKRIRQAEKTNFALRTGFYYSRTPVSAGVKRAKARLYANRNAQAKRLMDISPPQHTRQQKRAAARAAEKKATRPGPNTSRKRVRPAPVISPASAGATTSLIE